VTQDQVRTALVVGIGNPDRGDDGVGAEVVRRVDARQLAGVRVSHCREPLSLLDEHLDEDIVVVVDAVVGEAAVGTVTVRNVNARPFPESTDRGGTHAMGLGAVVELARALGRLPQSLFVVGVEAAAFETGTGLSMPVRAAIEHAADAVEAVVRRRP
jgi:hydrogenase maturation protease